MGIDKIKPQVVRSDGCLTVRELKAAVKKLPSGLDHMPVFFFDRPNLRPYPIVGLMIAEDNRIFRNNVAVFTNRVDMVYIPPSQAQNFKDPKK